MAFKNKINNLKECLENNTLYDNYYKCDIDDDIIYLESRNGQDFTGNIFRIVEEISSGDYGNFKIYVYATEDVKSKIELFQKNYNLDIYKVISDKKEAVKILFRAKYIFTDSNIQYKFIKKPGQIFVNTWHGTPLKLMGFDNPSERLSIGIIQRAFFFSDYLLYPNDFMMDKMTTSYMIDKIYPGKILLEGYPRNSVFLNKSTLKDKLGLSDKEVFIYMPTYKGTVANRKDEKQKRDVNAFLNKLDLKLNDNQVLFVKFHPFNQSQIDFSSFSHIKAFPEGFENYDVLNTADVLITDYSSVFFDFANTKRKIILFNYDEQEYLKDRGIYIPLEDLPFPKVQSIDDLIHELNTPKNYDDSEFVSEFCKYESVDSVKRICNRVLNNENDSKYKIIENSKKNILIYVGSMENNKALNQLIQMLRQLDENVNVFISYKPWSQNIKENYMTIFEDFPDNIEFLPLSFNIAPSLNEKIDLNKFIKKDNKNIGEKLINLFKRSYKRQYGDFQFDLVLDFLSNDFEQSLLFAHSGLKNAIVIDKNTKTKAYTQFSEIYEISEVNLKEIIYGEDKWLL